MGTLDQKQIDDVDIAGSLETIGNLALLGMRCIHMGWKQFIPTLLEDIFEYSQRLTEEYAVVGQDRESV